MTVETVSAGRTPKGMIWTGRIISGLLVLMMAGGGVFTLINPAQAKAEMEPYGYSGRAVVAVLIVEVACALLYAIPQTAVLGAVLLTGYLGGAVATHVQKGEWELVFAVVAGVLVWLGLYLRDARVRALLPLRR